MFLESNFKEGEKINALYTCEGENISPPLTWGAEPEGTRSFALIMDDPDVPHEVREDRMFVHWVLFNIPHNVHELSRGESAGTMGINTAGKLGYIGPCPPPRYQPTTHRYIFKLYAVDTILDLPEGATKEQLLSAMEGHVLDTATLIGTYDMSFRSI